MINMPNTEFVKAVEWIFNTNENNADIDVVSTLAILKLYEIHSIELDKSFKNKIAVILNKNEVLSYHKNDLITSLLSALIVIEYGNQFQTEYTFKYLSILDEFQKNSSEESLNSILLNGFFNNVEKASIESDIFIKWHENNIEETLKKLMFKIELGSHFGMLHLKLPSGVLNYLEGAIIYFMKQYDLPMMMRCLRSLNYIASTHTSLAIKTGISFLKHQQTFDGSFGDYETSLSNIKDIKERTVQEMKIKTPISIQALWTLYELESNNNLLKILAKQFACLKNLNENMDCYA
ncbi:hypothetical protein [Aquimarina algiphila]|uniref:hypothetical protein n=1 Tax=Aquimarina algiphila TaxID=2047982 RepID=UPI00232BCB48|nr:hypothetical protein [Aquimarina algiphila]